MDPTRPSTTKVGYALGACLLLGGLASACGSADASRSSSNLHRVNHCAFVKSAPATSVSASPGALAGPSSDEPGPTDALIRMLMKQRGMTGAQARAYVNHLDEESARIGPLAKAANMGIYDFGHDATTGDLVGYVTSAQEEAVLKQAHVKTIRVCKNTAELQTTAQAISHRIPTGTKGFYGLAPDVKTQRVEVDGTKRFFATSLWKRVARAYPEAHTNVHPPGQGYHG